MLPNTRKLENLIINLVSKSSHVVTVSIILVFTMPQMLIRETKPLIIF